MLLAKIFRNVVRCNHEKILYMSKCKPLNVVSSCIALWIMFYQSKKLKDPKPGVRGILCLICPSWLIIQISQNFRIGEKIIFCKLLGGMTSSGRIMEFSNSCFWSVRFFLICFVLSKTRLRFGFVSHSTRTIFRPELVCLIARMSGL